MKLSDDGEGRIRGYLYLLMQSLGSLLGAEVARDCVREVESHIRDRYAEKLALSAEPAERELLDAVLSGLGPPLELAKIYSAELAIDEALETGGLRAILKAVGRGARVTVGSSAPAIAVFLGYGVALAFFLVVVAKIFFPDSVGLLIRGGWPVAYGLFVNVPDDARVAGGYWNIPISLVLGAIAFALTHRMAKRWLQRLRQRLHESANGPRNHKTVGP